MQNFTLLVALPQVIHSRIIRQVNTAYKVFTSEWDFHTETIIQSLGNESQERVRKLNDIRERICWDTRRLRKIVSQFEQAVERGLTEQCYPFRHVYTGKDKTSKRAVPLATIKKVKSLDLKDRPALEMARDMFMFSFYTRGMSFVDMASLKTGNLQSGFLVYRRHKTGQQLTIKWEKCMKELVDKYAGSSFGYLLPIITEVGDEREQYKQMQYRINYNLKQVSS